MIFPHIRPRRLRSSATMRALVEETKVYPEQLIRPCFVVPDRGIKTPIGSLPGHFRVSIDQLILDCQRSFERGIRSFLLFGIPSEKDDRGEVSCRDDGIVQQAVRALKDALPQALIIADVCLCEYTTHGHCGVIKHYDAIKHGVTTKGGATITNPGQVTVDNDATLEILARQAISLAGAGADVLAPSGMMDGTIATLREALDNESFEGVTLMGYSVKYASGFYGPFREAVDSAPQFGDRRTYQMDCANRREALREALLDEQEGADILMVKPALPYLDIIRELRDTSNLPLAAYQVSGEYAMIKAAHQAGWIDGPRVMLESLTAIKRAGADMIITYFADEFTGLVG